MFIYFSWGTLFRWWNSHAFGCLNVASIIYLGYSFMLFCVAVGVCVKVTSCYLSNFYNVELPIQQVKLVTTSYYLIVEIHCLVQFSNYRSSCYLSYFYSFRITDPTSETGDNQLLPASWNSLFGAVFELSIRQVKLVITSYYLLQ